MALSNLTKVQTVGIGSNIEVVGVVTTGQFKSGTSNLHSTGVELTNLNVSGIATIGGNLSVGGVLTYQDVTNVDSLGIVTARAGVNVSGGQLDVGSNIKLGNAGVVTATSFVGSGANLTSLPTQVTITNNADNRVITGGSGTNLNGEANLTYNGNNFQFNTTANGHAVILKSTGNYYNKLSFDSGNTSAGGELAYIDFSWDGDKVADIFAEAGSDTTNKDDGHLVFRTSPQQGNIAERVRITSAGKVGIGTDLTTTPSSTLTVSPHTTGGRNISIYTSGAVGNKAGLFFNATSGTGNLAEIQAEYKGTNSGDLIFNTSMVERLRITSGGEIRKAQGANVTSLKTYNSHSDAFWLDHYQYQVSSTYQRYTDIVSIGDGTWGSNIRFFTNANGSANGIERLRIHSGGIVTVGDHNGSAYGGQMVVSTATGGVLTCADTGSGERLRLEGGSGIGRIGTDSNHDLVFITNGTSNERLRIGSDGNIRLLSENGNNSDTPGIYFRGGSSSQKANFAKIHSRMTSNWGGQLQFKVKNDNGSLSDAYQTAMIMNQDGTVTKPLQPSFAAAGTGSYYTIGNTSDFPFSNEQFDITNNYNTTNYRFTCPVDGRYLFWFNLFLYGTQPTGENRVWFKVNGNNGIHNGQTVRQGQSDLDPWTGTVIADLDENDYVTVGTWQNISGTQIYQGHSGWGGYLLG